MCAQVTRCSSSTLLWSSLSEVQILDKFDSPVPIIALPDTVVLYFSASWSPSAQLFHQTFVGCARPHIDCRNPKIAVVYVSEDRNQDAFNRMLSNTSFHRVQFPVQSKVLTRFRDFRVSNCVEDIPCVIVLDMLSRYVVSVNGVGEIKRFGTGALNNWIKRDGYHTWSMSIRQFSIYSTGAAHTLMGALSRILRSHSRIRLPQIWRYMSTLLQHSQDFDSRYIDQVPEIVVITPRQHQDDASNNIVDAETDNYEPIPMKSMNPENPSMLPLEVMTSALIYTNEKKVEDPFMTVNDQLLVSPPASPTANQANWNFILSSNARVDIPVVPSDSLYSVSLENSGGQLADSIFSENRITKGQNVSPSMTDFSMVSPAASVLVFGDSSSLWASQHRKVSFGVIAEIDETQDNVDGYVSSADDGDIFPERGIAIPQGRGKKTFEN